jgi:hypothetical protein
MHINNTQFSILLSSVTLVNTVLPLVAGFFVDDITSLGSIRATTLVSLVILVGSLLVSIGASINSYPCMMTGQIVYGLGGGMIVTMQEGILSRWFRDKQLTVIIGVMLCLARLTKWVAKMVTYPIVNSTGSHAWPLYVATIFCASGVVMNFVYWFVMWRNGCATIYGKEIVQFQGAYHNQFENEKQGEQGEKRTESNLTTNSTPTRYQSKKASFKWTFSLLFYIPSTYWMVPLIQLVMSSVLSSFDDVAT